MVVACVTVKPDPGSPAPRNTCATDSDCARYVQAGVAPTCTGGICQTTHAADWTAVVSLSQDALYAAGSTFAVKYSDLLKTQSSGCATGSTCPPGQLCVQLPALTSSPPMDLEVTRSGAMTANWNLGNASNTSLPVTTTLRDTRGQLPLQLPLAPIEIRESLNDNVGAPPGPGGGLSFQFSVEVPSLAVYEQTLMPVPPFDQAFPPDIRQINLTSMPPSAMASVYYGCTTDPRCTPFDPIPSGSGTPTYPMFDFSRADGGRLDGWVVFLRDQTTLRRISNIVTLAGTQQDGVQLLTSHHPASGSAFENAALVMQPPASSGLPTAIFLPALNLLGRAEPYPLVPPPAQVSGRVLSVTSGQPVAADVVFEANTTPTGLCRVNSGQTVLDQTGDLAFTASIHTDDGSFSIALPLGVYRATARPSDQATEVTVVPNFATTALVQSSDATLCGPPVQPKPIALDVARNVRGLAKVADNRPLAAATIEAIPTQCAVSPSDATCMPRPSQTITNTDGSYSIFLDPGVYVLRARPAEGSALPWVYQTLSVSGSAAVTGGPDLIVQAPVYAGLILQDPGCNPIVEGLVRVYETPATGAAIEIGEALTDSTGHYDMYLAPPPQ
jgi:hypothetical protein